MDDKIDKFWEYVTEKIRLLKYSELLQDIPKLKDGSNIDIFNLSPSGLIYKRLQELIQEIDPLLSVILQVRNIDNIHKRILDVIRETYNNPMQLPEFCVIQRFEFIITANGNDKKEIVTKIFDKRVKCVGRNDEISEAISKNWNIIKFIPRYNISMKPCLNTDYKIMFPLYSQYMIKDCLYFKEWIIHLSNLKFYTRCQSINTNEYNLIISINNDIHKLIKEQSDIDLLRDTIITYLENIIGELDVKTYCKQFTVLPETEIHKVIDVKLLRSGIYLPYDAISLTEQNNKYCCNCGISKENAHMMVTNENDMVCEFCYKLMVMKEEKIKMKDG